MRPSTKLRILVVDDEEAITYVFERYLSIAGYEVSVASRGEAALEVFRTRPADLLITDYRMPGLTGVELIERLRALNPALPALLISANPVDIGALPARVQFFPKPVSMEALLDVVASNIG